MPHGMASTVIFGDTVPTSLRVLLVTSQLPLTHTLSSKLWSLRSNVLPTAAWLWFSLVRVAAILWTALFPSLLLKYRIASQTKKPWENSLVTF